MDHIVWLSILACSPTDTKATEETTPSDLMPETSEVSKTEETGETTEDTALPGSCADLWSDPIAVIDANVVRPDPGYSGMNISLTYAIEGDSAVVTLEGLSGRSGVSPGFAGDIYAYSGKFAQLRDANDAVLYTQSEYYLIQESAEVPGTTGFSNVEFCPDDGYILLMDYPNAAAAEWVVLIQERIDGRMENGPLQEIVRIPLP